MLNSTQLYMCSRRQRDDLFPQKKMSFYFNHPRDPDVRSRSQKVGSLKDFEVCSVIEKVPLHNGQKSYQLICHGHLLEEKRKVLA
jgi:hypothetical protein